MSWLYHLLDDYAGRRPDVINYVSARPAVPVEERAEPTEPEPDVAAFHDFPIDSPIDSLQWEDVNAVLVAEVISEDDPAKDLVRNPVLYLEVPSIREYWVIDPRRAPTVRRSWCTGGAAPVGRTASPCRSAASTRRACCRDSR